MDNTIKYKVIDKKEFLKEYFLIKPIILGKGKVIAEEAGVAYHTYRNAVSGKINNPAVLGTILRACRVVHKDVIDHYSKKLHSER